MTAKVTSAGIAATSLGTTTATIKVPTDAIPILDFVVWSGEINAQAAFITVQHVAFLTSAILGAIAVLFTLRREIWSGRRAKK